MSIYPRCTAWPHLFAYRGFERKAGSPWQTKISSKYGGVQGIGGKIVVLEQKQTHKDDFWFVLKELRHDILSYFFDGLNCGSSVGKPRHNGLLRKKNTKGVILKQKGTRMAEDIQD